MHAAIGDPTLTNAILYWLVHNAHRLTLAGKSMRKRQNGLTREAVPEQAARSAPPSPRRSRMWNRGIRSRGAFASKLAASGEASPPAHAGHAYRTERR
ncbi:ATP-binding protein [Burkholderia stagnalis]|uniref:ATP-binding protein n=1 Tax=Burkholderia stagnalis TaxID=1503054 RepID=UPI0021AB5799|nr:ATP-binding protein [Burkholderia stagnalis]